MKRFLLPILFSGLFISISAQDVVINEVAYSNKRILRDFDGDSPDWFELYNPSTFPVNIGGFQVTDNLQKNQYWSFPAYTLEPGHYLHVFASGKDTIIDLEWHTSFKLGSMRESLFLLDNNGIIIDSVSPQCVPPGNNSLSRIPDGNAHWYAAHSTPGNSNDLAEIIPVEFNRDTLMISHSSGYYSAPVSIVLTNLDPRNTIVFTLNGDDPDEEACKYEEALYLENITPNNNRFAQIPDQLYVPGNKISKANILRAVVISNGCPASNEISNTYFIGDDFKDRYKVPVVSMITDEDNLFDNETGIYVAGKYENYNQHGAKWERDTHIEIFDSAGVQIIDQDGGMRIHGRGSRRADQKSFRLYADAEYGKAYFDYPLFKQKPDIERYEVILMRTTAATRGPVFKEELCNNLVQGMNIDYNAGETAILFLNGEYWGIYNLMERQNEEYIKANYKVDDPQADIVAYDWGLIVEEGDSLEYEALIQFITSSDPGSEDFFDALDSYVDVDAMIDYYIAELYIANTDWPSSNLELWKLKNDTARWRYFFFDSDASFMWINDDQLSEYNNTMPDYQRHPEYCTIIMRTALNNKEFRDRFFREFHYHLSTTFSTEKVINEINRLEKKYAELMPEHIYRWNNPTNYNKWLMNVASLRTFAMQRPSYLHKQLVQNFGNPYILYPNPGKGDFSLQFVGDVSFASVRIYTVNGVLLQTFSFPNINASEINISSHLSSGIYVVSVTTDSYVFTEKLVVQE